MAKNFATHCDTEVRFFETEDAAVSHAMSEIEVSRSEKNDGWDEDVTEGIVVMKVIHRAEKIDPNVDYRCVDYRLGSVE